MILSDPLRLEGLKSVVFRYNRARERQRPAGHEDQTWLSEEFTSVFNAVNSSASSLETAAEPSEEQVVQMLEAFSKNSEAYYDFYKSLQEEFEFQMISADQMLVYLSAYAIIASSADRELWNTLSSITGVWPLCFWQS